MKVVGIISEYDPFHNGHKYQTDKLREMGAEKIVSVLGGAFSQRGSAHIADKYLRAECAVASGGCDLVLELPFPYSCTAAEFFARAGVHIAAQFCDSLAFGCEEADTSVLTDIAELTVSLEFRDTLIDRQFSSPSASAPKLICELIKEALSEKHANAAALPNNILAIEYLRAIYAGGYDLKPIFIKREGAEHDSSVASSRFASASHIRSLILSDKEWSEYVPNTTYEILSSCTRNSFPLSLDFAERAVLYSLWNSDAEEADGFSECSGGLGRRIVNASAGVGSLRELYELLATKRYTNARIRRAIISLLLGVKEDDVKALPRFTNLLAANAEGTQIIKKTKFPVCSVPSALRALDCARQVELYLKAENLKSLCFGSVRAPDEAFRKRPLLK